MPPVNLASALLGSGDPSQPALLGPDGPVTRGDLAGAAGRLAALFAERGAERVALVAGNEPAFVVAYLAALTAGAVAAPLNPAAPPAEIARELDSVEPSLVVASPAYADAAHAAVAACRVAPPEVLVYDDDLVAALASRSERAPVERGAGDLAALLFTAGTAGAPKAAMLTHGSLLANLEQIQRHPDLALSADDVVLGVLPFFHVFGLNVVLGLALRSGAAVALVDHFDPAGTLARLHDDRVSVLAAVPAVYAAWLALPESVAAADCFDGVRFAVSGAAALPGEVAAAMSSRFGLVVHEGYGLTEASPVVTTAALGGRTGPGCIGPPLPGVEVRLVDTDGADVLSGDPGEIWVRGPNVFAGYWRDEEASAAVLTGDGWLKTGDVAVADDSGSLTLVDRAKDLVIVSGFNVYPAEVEDVLRAHPSVAEAAVGGEPHPRTGEAVVAYVVPAEGETVDPADLVRFAGRRLARYKLPARVEVVPELPRGLGGKVLRRSLEGKSRNPA